MADLKLFLNSKTFDSLISNKTMCLDNSVLAAGMNVCLAVGLLKEKCDELSIGVGWYSERTTLELHRLSYNNDGPNSIDVTYNGRLSHYDEEDDVLTLQIYSSDFYA